ncbi:hypothetical protein F4604DRAFT_1780592, partial [Suillus subluteus]
MSNTRLLLRLLKRLCQVLATLITSSAQRLRILVTYFRHFVAKLNLKIRGFPGTILSRRDPLLQTVVLCRPALPQVQQAAHKMHCLQCQCLYQCIPQQPIPPQTFSPPQVPNANPSSAPAITPKLVPFATNDISRYENRPLVYVNAVYINNGLILRMHSQGVNADDRLFRSCPWLSGDWKSRVHPEGVLYLYNERRSVFTEATMDRSMFKFARQMSQTKSLVVQLAQTATGGAQVSCYYYFKTDVIFSGLRGVTDPSHIRYSLESEYWC